MTEAWIVAIGTELALGQSVDTNSAWLANELAALGIRATRHITLADDLPAITETLRHAGARCDVLLISGGLGPTDDDLTRQALADAAGVELELDPLSLDQIRAFFVRRGREMPERNRVQAFVPRGARMIPNSSGTAPGIELRLERAQSFSMPGVPFEMKQMFAASVAPQLAAVARGNVLLSRTIHTYGMPESELGDRIRDLMQRGRNPEVGTTANLGDIGIRINASAANAAAAGELLDADEAEIRKRLGRVVYGRDSATLASAVGTRLVEREETLSTAESCTGGLIGKLLTDVAGSSRYFRGGEIAYANDVKHERLGVRTETLERYGAVSCETAQEMALGVRAALQSTFALSVTGIAGPDGGTSEKPVGLVCLGLATPQKVFTRELRFGDDSPRAVIRDRAARTALNLLRLELD